MKSFVRMFLIAATLLCVASLPPTFAVESTPQKIQRVACVGDSITLGSGTKLPLLESYPAQLQRMLDPKLWFVQNFGASGATLLNKGDKPFQKRKLFRDALNSNPDVVIILFGANDSKPQNWKFKDEFTPDYRDVIGKFKALASQPRIFICRPMVASGAGNYGITDPVIQEEIPLIDAVAKEEAVGLIDMHAALLGKDALVPDRVHPNADGANFLARTAYRALTGKEFTGVLNSLLHSEWMGCQQIQFESDGRAGYLVLPKTAAPGNPWIWRTEFANTEPQADLALLAKGWHVAYLNVQNMYGSPAALDEMDKFYTQVAKENHLAPKVVLEGFSRGGLFAFNWAARNPGKVASIYADAPVLDFKSWPGGKGKGLSSPQDWQRLLKIYGLTEEEALAYKLNPLDNLKPLADAKIPILSVCGDSDKTVPFDENTQIMEKRYKEIGGDIQVITKPGGDHHPHSLNDPTPIVEFILKHAPTKQ